MTTEAVKVPEAPPPQPPAPPMAVSLPPPSEAPKATPWQQFREKASKEDLLEAAKWGRQLHVDDVRELRRGYEAQINAAKRASLDRLPEEERDALKKEWVEHFVARGVDATLFEPDEDGGDMDLRSVKILGQRAMKALSAANARAAKTGDGAKSSESDTELLTRIERLEGAVRGTSAAGYPMTPNGGAPRPQVDKDNIDRLNMEGVVSDADYRAFLSTGKLP